MNELRRAATQGNIDKLHLSGVPRMLYSAVMQLTMTIPELLHR
jgi:hypothetical protein